MNERDLRYFVAIVDCRGIGAAAQRLGVTQPAVTKCVDRLEDVLRTPLLSRKGRYVELTPAGIMFHRRAKAILLRMEDAMQELSNHATGHSGHVRLGAAATMTEALLPGVLKRVMQQTPGITIELATGMNDVLREALRENRLDLLISPTTAGGDEFESEPLISDRVVVVARRGHPLCSKPSTMADMLRYQWILPPSTVALRRWLDHSFERAGLSHPRVQVEVNSLVLMPRLIGDTDLISFASSQKLDGTGLVEIACPETTHDRSFGLLYRRDAFRSPAVDTVAAFLRIVTKG